MPIHIRYDSKRQVSIVEGEAPYQISTNERITKTLLKRHKPIIAKTNPIKVALEYEKYYKSPSEPSMAKVGEHFGVSRVRICQVLNLLKLDKRIIDYVANITDAKENNFWTERKLRTIINLKQNLQYRLFEEFYKRHFNLNG